MTSCRTNQRNQLYRYLLLSLALHIAIVSIVFRRSNIERIQISSDSVEVTLKRLPWNATNSGLRPKSSSAAQLTGQLAKKIDLRPDFVRKGVLPSDGLQQGSDIGYEKRFSNAIARELLFTEPKVFAAFDRLAEKINQHLDYPVILIENGVQGAAILDLYFDHNGDVDEVKSKLYGDNRSVRGLFVRAARTGIIKWYQSDAHALRKEQFKDQHFRAFFEISYVLSDANRMEKTGLGSYSFLRRRYMHECAQPTMGVDLTCLAMKAAGAVQRSVSDSYKMKLQALQDNLDHYDTMGLAGVTALIRGS